jgi:hypothetical protein
MIKMKCSTCNYKKHIPLYTKCAGVPGRTKVGTAYYCGHPEMENPVPVISPDKSVLEDCPVTKNIMSSSENMQDVEVSRL